MKFYYQKKYIYISNFEFYRQIDIIANLIYGHNEAMKSVLKEFYSFFVSILFDQFLNIIIKYFLSIINISEFHLTFNILKILFEDANNIIFFQSIF